MQFIRPTTWSEALQAKADHPEAWPVAGGTDVLVELNFDRRRPEAVLDLSSVGELRPWTREDDHVRLGAGTTYTDVLRDLPDLLPGLTVASRGVGSPQIRNRGTVAGNLGSASPAGDAHPPLLASGAEVEVASVRGPRRIAIDDFYLGVKRNALEPDELIAAIRVPVAPGPQQYAKIGTRNAMVIAVCSFAVALDPVRRRVGTGIGSAAPTPRRAVEAEGFLTERLDGRGLWEGTGPLDEETLTRFGALVAAAAQPIDDVRGTAAYRRHALSVLARRTLTWCWDDLRARREAA
ncbi:MAG: Xanthine dehydrogenase, FAD binding subunit [uncultured Thermoleophilia bacterium]|uniref:Xanthine dehydrogenase, FAD binding subunit n=1 Tax=uncultured Thermoleophilia bacterium TaxID=1497501 RepID=A0A6J4UNF3_9ACTN|nr:MAG: Xanthine dehydrogenase, FAD binding subunit [uncultured Thermoleophilia bacterium]